MAASAWRSRNTGTSMFMPASDSLLATDSLVEPIDSSAVLQQRRIHAPRADGRVSLTRPCATRVTKEGRRSSHAITMHAIPEAARAETTASTARAAHGFISLPPGSSDPR